MANSPWQRQIQAHHLSLPLAWRLATRRVPVSQQILRRQSTSLAP